MTWETETFTVPELEKILAGKKKKYIRYEEGITLYSMGKIPLRQLAQEAHALIYLKHAAVINTEILDEYIERYPLCYASISITFLLSNTNLLSLWLYMKVLVCLSSKCRSIYPPTNIRIRTMRLSI